ncbi:MAG: coenzyme F420-0:L-glutamate ligase [Salinarchaeum sp.]
MHVSAVQGLPELRPGDNIATLIDDRTTVTDDTVVCISSTIVSKAEDRGRDLVSFSPDARARSIADTLDTDPRFVQAVLEESEELLITDPFLLTVTTFGHTAPNAGIDRSNVPNADLLLLPLDPDESASRIRSQFDADPAVIVTDTCGRPFRHGQRGVAIGHAGIPAARDWRGESDRDGRELSATVEAVVDELAAAANVVTGEGDGGRPVALIEDFDFGDHAESNALFRDRETDLVRQALAEWT